jgi:catechol 2,3-dioxygenase-like lactoylglutathione lyase family enzyme
MAPPITGSDVRTLAATAWKIIPIFPSRDIKKTIKLYTEQLGFYAGSEKPGFCSLAAGPKAFSNIYFTLVTNEAAFHPGQAMIALGAEQLDELFVMLLEQGLYAVGRGRQDEFFKVVENLKNMEWGFRQFAIEDPDGNKITFFRSLEGTNGEEYWEGTTEKYLREAEESNEQAILEAEGQRGGKGA